MNAYLETVKDVYREAALQPAVGLCCTSSPVWQLPGLHIPKAMLDMNYGCGSTVHPRDLVGQPSVLYVGVGGGMELLQFAYFCRRPGAVIGVEPVAEMRDACSRNLDLAAADNAWFDTKFVDMRAGDALALPLENGSVQLAAQNCLFNVFEAAELRKVISEMYRVLKPQGRLVMSDPICEAEIPAALRKDQRLRAECLSGAIPLAEYIACLTDSGFGTIEVRARRPYRVLDKSHYQVQENILIESVEVCAIKDPMPDDGPCVFTGRNAIYIGREEIFDDGKGHVLGYNQPLSICDKTALALSSLDRDDLIITGSTYFYDGGGCC